jgi:DNA modification methylase
VSALRAAATAATAARIPQRSRDGLHLFRLHYEEISPMTERRLEYIPLSEIKPAKRNPKRHALSELGASFEQFGYVEPVVIDERTGLLVAGHGRREELLELRKAGETPPDGIQVRADEWLVPVLRGWASKTDDEAEAFLLTSNRLVELGAWYKDELAHVIADIQARGQIKLQSLGWAQAEIEAFVAAHEGTSGGPSPTLKDRFLVPPFSVLDARQGYWKDRKAAWLALGIQSEVGRGENLLKMSDTALEPDAVKRARRKAKVERDRYAATGGSFGAQRPEAAGDASPTGGQTGTSIFDPVLCELAYRWFSPANARVLDPFAGGSVRGIVAAKLERRYVGIDLRAEQIAANRGQGRAICGKHGPEWIEGDSIRLARLAAGEFDFIFSCPPYADLERYSDDPRDLSTMDYDVFVVAYRKIIAAACAKLKRDRFACFVVGDVRSATGTYRNFPGDTIAAFEAAGLKIYNEAILVTSIGSLPIRVGKQFTVARKLGKTHQNVYVFVKGDPRKATKACGAIEVAFPGAEAAGEGTTVPADLSPQ